ncbi:ABC transporter CDR4 [Hypsizygus marmoreus]|uniref:ABC transporter CDR4 n=1 Tax=Hypsizygus marmoreus TaxID=39966 RepID=A0A369K156_HYPMA|nr:ABC transporter CDR4 [Hypsizygus marmoreus]
MDPLPVANDEMIMDADGFAGAFSEHKYEIVKRLQGLGHLCAMTGDGANDPLLCPTLTIALVCVIVETSFFQNKFGVNLEETPTVPNDSQLHMIIYLQVAMISQAHIFITRSHGFFFMERPSTALLAAFGLAQLVSSIIAAYGNWGFTDIRAISGGWIGIVWIWNIIWFMPLDWIKFAMKATIIKYLRERREAAALVEKISGIPITHTQSHAASIHESLYSNLSNRSQHSKQEEADIMTCDLGVLFEDLCVVGLGSLASYQPTLGSVLNLLSIIDQIQKMRHPPLRNILSGFEGVVRPEEMLRCSTFLKTLANHHDEYYAVEGNIHYDSLTPAEITKHYRGDVQYCPEDDVHFPTLTVQQTLDFAAKMSTPKAQLHATRSEYVTKVTEVLMTIFGLKHTKNTPVGDAVCLVERRSVCRFQRHSPLEVVCMPGTNSSTALEFGRALRIATDVDRCATIVSIYQAGGTLYDLFDKVCVLYEGQMAYFGPADQACQYFIDMGYDPVNRQTTPDFLVAITDPKGHIPHAGVSNIPRTASEFAEYFLKSSIAQMNRNDVNEYKDECVGIPDRAHTYKQSVRAEQASYARKQSYVNSYCPEFGIVIIVFDDASRVNSL